MAERITLPKFDANITEGTVGQWHKKEGDPVKPGELLVDIITDKANFELTAECEGILRRVIAPEKSQVPVGYVIALVGDADEELPDVDEENARRMAEHLASAAGKTIAAPPVGGGDAESRGDDDAESRGGADIPVGGRSEGTARPRRIRATPRARRLARENDLDLADVQRFAEVDMVSEKNVEDYLREKSS